MENNINILDELNKGCCMGIDALKFILEKVINSHYNINFIKAFKTIKCIKFK